MFIAIGILVIFWIILIFNKVTHVLAYLGMLALSVFIGWVASTFSTHYFLKDFEWREESREKCENWQANGKYITYYLKQNNAYYLRHNYRIDSIAVKEDGSDVYYVSYRQYARPSSKQFWWGNQWIGGNGSSDYGTYAYQIECPPDKMQFFVK